jgi:hypothetical protein
MRGGFYMTFNNGAGNSGSGGTGGFLPFIQGVSNNVNPVKLNEDSYDVYVNNNFVGQKSLKNQGEQLSDIDDFLKHQGINEFSSSLNGDQYRIETEGQTDDITNALEVYFNNR